jgi:hypothetical protein
MQLNRADNRTRCGLPRIIQSKWLGSWWSIESGVGRADQHRWRKLQDRLDADLLSLRETLRQCSDQPVMQGAALIVLIMDPRIVLMGPGLRLVGFRDRGDLRGFDMAVFMDHVDVDQRGHAPDLRDEEQAKQPWAEALKPT